MADDSSDNTFKPKWTHYHPQSTVWVQNPFDHDVEFQVADEHNQPWRYKIPANKVGELPGGAVATLGVKAIIDEMIQNDKENALRLYEAEVRTKYEDQVVLRVKQSPSGPDRSSPTGEIDLSVKDAPKESDSTEPKPANKPKPKPQPKEEQAFPGVKNEVDKVAQASIAGKKDAVIEDD